PYYQKAVNLGQRLEANNKNIKVEGVAVHRNQWQETLQERKEQYGGKAVYHGTCPIIEEGCSEDAVKFVGGYAEFLNEARKRNYR
ncbi:hypothetical protein SAMD00019534_078520, partial [Acytostelium subglobosum LB1]|uniref:hypothetical protein n=1 Tax=Acytostelium subglobosum LB1 TaxID=1410327 RepID=UPI00064517D1